MATFRNIDYGRMLYETLRSYFSVNSDGDLSIMFKYLYACLIVLQQPFFDYDTFRRRAALIANCKWQIGQLTNVLNYLFDQDENRIYITQNQVYPISDPTFEYAAIEFDPVFDEVTDVYEREFLDSNYQSVVIINIPDSVNQAALIAVVEQIKLEGIPYQINVI